MTETAKKLGREYETIYVLRPTVTPEVLRAVADRINKVLERTGGTLTSVENWGRRELAYRVEKFRRGVYVLIRYIGNGVTVSEIERNFRVVDDVMKYQTVLFNGEVELASLDTTGVEFGEIELVEDDAPEISLAEELGLVENARRRAPVEDEDDEDNEVPEDLSNSDVAEKEAE
jgi:small subunit ribosomal protein S6